MQEAMEKIKCELGNDAVILHTRYFKEGGFLGLFRKRYVEVTAAVDQSSRQVFELPPEKNPTGQVGRGQEVSADLAAMRQIMQEMSLMLSSLNEPKLPKGGRLLYEHLIQQEVDSQIALQVVKTMLQDCAQIQLQSEEELYRILSTYLLKPIEKIYYQPTPVKKGAPRILTFIGPTGVGKTTTIAKLAAIDAVMKKKKVALITIDTYRIAAVEQLKTIGEIMNVPVKVVFNPENLQDCLQEICDYDVVYIDTAGRSHKNEAQVNELKEYLGATQSDDLFLVLASTSKYQDFIDILETYRDVNISSLIFTKVDETSNYGSLYNLVYQKKYPIAYFANGQNIPDDIEVAEPQKLVQMLMKEK